jgi:hypothetical protein
LRQYQNARTSAGGEKAGEKMSSTEDHRGGGVQPASFQAREAREDEFTLADESLRIAQYRHMLHTTAHEGRIGGLESAVSAWKAATIGLFSGALAIAAILGTISLFVYTDLGTRIEDTGRKIVAVENSLSSTEKTLSSQISGVSEKVEAVSRGLDQTSAEIKVLPATLSNEIIRVSESLAQMVRGGSQQPIIINPPVPPSGDQRR